MINNYYQQHKTERYQNLSEEGKRQKAKKGLRKIPKKKNQKGLSIIKNVSSSYLSTEEMII